MVELIDESSEVEDLAVPGLVEQAAADDQQQQVTAAKANEKAKAACLDTVTRCNKFVNPTPQQVRDWSKGKQVRSVGVV